MIVTSVVIDFFLFKKLLFPPSKDQAESHLKSTYHMNLHVNISEIQVQKKKRKNALIKLLQYSSIF